MRSIFSLCWSSFTGLQKIVLRGMILNPINVSLLLSCSLSFSLTLFFTLICVPRTRPTLFSSNKKQLGSYLLAKRKKKPEQRHNSDVQKLSFSSFGGFSHHFSRITNLTLFAHEAKVIA